MPERLKVLLVGTYLPDRNYSIINFIRTLEVELQDLGCEVRSVHPPKVVGKGGQGAGKWLGYLDKYLFYPPLLVQQSKWADVVHIVDQGSAIYNRFLPNRPVVQTCHDVLAIRSALGEDTACPISATGKVLQKLIRRSLSRCQIIACASEATRTDVRRVIGAHVESTTVHDALIPGFGVMDGEAVKDSLSAMSAALVPGSYLLHVGNSSRRKNRGAAIRALAKLGSRWTGRLVFAGAPMDEQMKELARDLGVQQAIIELPHRTKDEIVALYNGAFALLLPSYSEGFGFPVLEAQACGCPVICSNRTSLPEVAGEAALLVDPDDADGLAAAVIQLVDAKKREALIKLGFANIRRFTIRDMAKTYLELYRQLLLGREQSVFDFSKTIGEHGNSQ